MEMTVPSKLSPSEVLEQIKANVDNRGILFGSIFGTKPFIGSFSGDKFKMYKRIYYGNSFIPIFYGEVVPAPGGSEIRGKFHMYLPVRIFMGVWFTGVGAGCIGVLAALFKHKMPEKDMPGLFIPFIMLAFGIFLVKSGKWLCRGHYAAIEQYLQACAGQISLPKDTYRIKPVLREGFWPFELLVRRFLAFAWDLVLPSIPFMLWMFVENPKIDSDPSGWHILPCFFIYESLALVLWGKGLGKKMAQLEVVTKEGKKLKLWQAVSRVAIKVICLIPMYAFVYSDYLIALSAVLFLVPYIFSKDHCFFHDLFTDSRVILQGSAKDPIGNQAES